MASMKRGAVVASMFILFTIIVAACERPASTPPSVTSTPKFKQSVSNTPWTTDQYDRCAESCNSIGTCSEWNSGSGVGHGDTRWNYNPGCGCICDRHHVHTTAYECSHNTNRHNGLSTGSTVLPGATNQPPATSVPGTRPATYILQAGEFPYCIARRFNVNPDQLLSLSGLVDGVIYPAGTTLRIPQSGSFPGDRMLQNHPTTYTVASSSETLYSIACKFGDVDPASIASSNGLSTGAALSAGQKRKHPVKTSGPQMKPRHRSA